MGQAAAGWTLLPFTLTDACGGSSSGLLGRIWMLWSGGSCGGLLGRSVMAITTAEREEGLWVGINIILVSLFVHRLVTYVLDSEIPWLKYRGEYAMEVCPKLSIDNAQRVDGKTFGLEWTCQKAECCRLWKATTCNGKHVLSESSCHRVLHAEYNCFYVFMRGMCIGF